jgi:uridine monophosphate synthetase
MVVVDREQGGRENLEELGYSVHALATITELVNCLLEHDQISNAQAEAVMEYVENS